MTNYAPAKMNDIVRNLDTDIRHSWIRCLNNYQMSPAAKIQPAVLTKPELKDQEEPLSDLLSLAGPEVKRLFSRLADSDYLVSVASPEGVKIFYRCDYHMIGQMEKLGVANGTKWSEDIQGTNGVGTCIKLKKPISVVGTDHFFNDIKHLSCTVVPVFGPKNRLECVLNITTGRETDKKAEKILRNILMRSALRIENGNFSRHYPHTRIIRLSAHEDFADPANELRIAIGDGGEILDATSPIATALQLDQERVVGRNLEEVLGVNVDLTPGAQPQPLHLDFLEQKRLFTKVDDQLSSIENAHHRMISPPIQARSNKTSALPVAIDQSVFREHPGLAADLPKAIKVIGSGLPLVLVGEPGSGREDLARLLSTMSGDQGFRTLRCDLEANDVVARCLTDTGFKGKLYLDNVETLPEHLERAVIRRISNATKSGPSSRLSFILGHTEKPDNNSKPLVGLLVAGMTVRLPPIREYPNRVEVIQKVFGQEKAACESMSAILAPETLELLANGLWPGNFDELRLVLRHSLVMCDTDTIRLDHLPENATIVQPNQMNGGGEDSEKQTVEFALELNRWNVSRTAKYLGVSRATLNRKIRNHQIERPTRD